MTIPKTNPAIRYLNSINPSCPLFVNIVEKVKHLGYINVSQSLFSQDRTKNNEMFINHRRNNYINLTLG